MRSGQRTTLAKEPRTLSGAKCGEEIFAESMHFSLNSGSVPLTTGGAPSRLVDIRHTARVLDVAYTT